MAMDADIAKGMARIRRALEARMRSDDRRERAITSKRKAEGGLVAYDTRGLARILRPALEWDGRGWVACAAEMGVTQERMAWPSR